MAHKLPAHKKRMYQKEIAHYEASTNGLFLYSGAYVFARNIREDHKRETVKANVIICKGEGEPVCKYENCEYPMNMFKD